MFSSSTDFLNLFVRPPGEILYYFSVVAVSLASLFMAVGQRLRRPNDTTAQRYTVALFGVVISWLALMAGALLTLVGDIEAVRILPPLERAASLVTILLLAWAFLTANLPSWGRVSSGLIVIALVIAVLAYGFSAVQWYDVAGRIDFNLSVLGATWTFVAAVLSAFGVILVLGNLRVVLDAPLKLLFFLLLLTGYGGTLIQIVQGNIIGDYAGPIRLAFLAALMLTPALVYRSIVSRFETEIAQQAARVQQVSPPPPREPAPVSPAERESIQLLRAMGVILDDVDAINVPDRIIRAVIETLHVDIAAILRLQDANYADVSLAYDNIMKRTIDGIAINLDNQPTLTNSIERQAQRLLTVERNAEELEDLFTRLDVAQAGPVYFQPMARNRELVAVLMVALPYTKRELTPGEAELLKGVAVIASSLLALSYTANEARMTAEERVIQAMVHGVAPASAQNAELISARQELQQNLQLAREQISELSKQVVQLKIQLDDERSRIAQALEDSQEGLSISQRIIAMRDEQQELRQERDELRRRLQETEAALHGALATSDEALINDLIESLRYERQELIQQRDSLQNQLDELRSGGMVILPDQAQPLVEEMESENVRLVEERDQFKIKLLEMKDRLKELGVDEGSAGLSQIISQLSEQRSWLQSQLNAAHQERDRLLQERTQYQEQMTQEEERDTRLHTLEVELRNLAGDREAITKQRDKLRADVNELNDKLETIKQHRTRLLAQAAGFEIELQEAYQEQTKLREQIQALAKERSDLIQQRDQLEAEKRGAETERDQLLARVEGDRDLIREVGTNGVGSLTAMIEELTEERNELEHQLTDTNTKLATVEKELESLRKRMSESEETIARYRPDNPDLLIGLVEEFRTPMTSIIGYVDLLLGESAGILGEMQRKFLQRVSTNVTRLSSMLDDLINVTELDTGMFKLEAAPVNVINLIEDAITNASNQFREKGLAVNLDLQDNLPPIQGDADAITQIIGQLLTNAYLVSPPSTGIVVTARQQQANINGQSVDCLFVSVQDRGGGISPEDEPRVFARKYKAENPLIQGLGDTGVGLSVAKALVEAHGGRLWLETVENVGSTFSFVLPFTEVTQPEGFGDAS